MKIVSWNVNGIRAIINKDFKQIVKEIDADIICLQETKATTEQVSITLQLIDGYNLYANAAKTRKGYSGTAILSKTKPISVQNDMGMEVHDQEGRVVAAEFEEFYVVAVYVPNSGNELLRLDYRIQWDKDFLEYLKGLEIHKPVVVCGDFNVAHRPIDLARPKENYNKSAGYTQREIDGFDAFINHGFVDTFRFKYPDTVKYSWWSYRAGARQNNVGWRIDYFLVSNKIIAKIGDAFILNEIAGSDHCPVGIIL